MASPLFAPYCSQGPAAQRFSRSCLMTHRARGIAHTAREVLAKRRRIIPGARSIVLRGIGHLSNLESPAAFNAAVGRFLAKAV